MLQVPISAVPAQTLNIVLDGQNASLSVYTEAVNADWYTFAQPNPLNLPATNLVTFFDVSLNGMPIKTGIPCYNLCRLLADTQYTAFVGDFVFVDEQGTSDPIYTGFGGRFALIYLEAVDL
jgi:hypothetical protein